MACCLRRICPLVLLGTAGCGILLNPVASGLLDYLVTFQDVAVPTALPGDLVTVSENRERFSVDEHPVLSLPRGTVVDDLTGLAGCWGRVQTTEQWVGSPGALLELREVTTLEVLEFDYETGIFTSHQLVEYDDGYTAQGNVEGLPLVITLSATFTTEGENRIRRTVLHGEAGALSPDGTLVPSVPAAMGVVGAMDYEWDSILTLDGDYLRIDYGGSSQAPPGAIPDTTLWMRLDCAESPDD